MENPVLRPPFRSKKAADPPPVFISPENPSSGGLRRFHPREANSFIIHDDRGFCNVKIKTMYDFSKDFDRIRNRMRPMFQNRPSNPNNPIPHRMKKDAGDFPKRRKIRMLLDIRFQIGYRTVTEQTRTRRTLYEQTTHI